MVSSHNNIALAIDLSGNGGGSFILRAILADVYEYDQVRAHTHTHTQRERTERNLVLWCILDDELDWRCVCAALIAADRRAA